MSGEKKATRKTDRELECSKSHVSDSGYTTLPMEMSTSRSQELNVTGPFSGSSQQPATNYTAPINITPGTYTYGLVFYMFTEIKSVRYAPF